MKNNSDYSAIIIGAGVATGSALTKEFAEEGYKYAQFEEKEIRLNLTH